MAWKEDFQSRLKNTPRFVWILLGLALAVAAIILFHDRGSLVGEVKSEQRTFDRLHEAGRVIVGVQSVAAFEDYIDSLQPKFQLTPEQAYQEAIAQTQVREIEEVRALLLKVAASFPQSRRLDPTTTERLAEASEKKEGTAGTGSEQVTSPEVPKPPAPEDLERALATLEAANRPLGTDPALRYRAAAALLQEVALLSNYVKDAAVSADTIPYVVRQLITVFPSARKEPYDIYTTIAYFGGKASALAGAFEQVLKEASEAGKPLSLPGELTCSGSKVEVVPLFVTDNLETSWLSSNRVAARDLDASGSGESTKLGVGLAAKSQQEVGARNLSRDLNSLFTVGRVAENAVEVRLGAASIDGTYQLVPRTFNLTSLVLVPRVSDKDIESVMQTLGSQVTEAEWTSLGLEVSVFRSALDALPCKTVRYTAHTEMRNADTGKVLPPPGFADLVDNVEQDMTALPPAFVRARNGDNAVDSKRLVEAALSGDFETFQSQSGLAEAAVPLIWARLSRLLAASGYANGSFPIYRPKIVFFNPDPQVWDAINKGWIHMAAPALFDDGKITRLRLSGAQGLSGKALTGYLEFTPKEGEANVTLTATAIKLEDEGRSAVIEFPSLRRIMRSGTTVSVGLSYQRNLYRWSDPVDRFSDWYRSGLSVVDVSPN